MKRAEPLDDRSLAEIYLRAKRMVLDNGYEAEIAWQEDVSSMLLTEQRFLSEAAWVILNSGMKEAIVRRIFPELATVFANFVTAHTASIFAADGGKARALRIFNHPRKIDAIIEIVKYVDTIGLAEVKSLLLTKGTAYLQTLPYIGPVTALHLAKNLGQDVAKPDRHLTRIACACGYDDPQALCTRLRDFLGEPIAVIDIVLWRYATLSTNYIRELIAEPNRLCPSSKQVVPAGRTLGALQSRNQTGTGLT